MWVRYVLHSSHRDIWSRRLRLKSVVSNSVVFFFDGVSFDVSGLRRWSAPSNEAGVGLWFLCHSNMAANVGSIKRWKEGRINNIEAIDVGK